MKKQNLSRTFIYLIILIICVIFILPIFWLFTRAFSAPDKIFIFPPEILPKPISFENVIIAFGKYKIHKYIFNTCFVVFLTIIGSIFSSSLVAYGFARLRFRGQNILFILLLSGMMIPWDSTIIPLFVMYSKIGWTNSYLPLIVPTFFCGYSGAFFVFLIRQYMMTIPYSLDEAAFLDGCNKFQIYWKIIMPNIKPALMTVIIYQFLWAWNDFLNPLIYIDDVKRFTLTLGIYMMKTPFNTDWGSILASSAIASIVPVAVFFITQDKLLGGLSMSGSKE